MEEAAAGAHKHLGGVGEPISLEERQHFGVQQSVASIKAVMAAMFARKFDASQQDFGLLFDGFDNLRL